MGEDLRVDEEVELEEVDDLGEADQSRHLLQEFGDLDHEHGPRLDPLLAELHGNSVESVKVLNIHMACILNKNQRKNI